MPQPQPQQDRQVQPDSFTEWLCSFGEQEVICYPKTSDCDAVACFLDHAWANDARVWITNIPQGIAYYRPDPHIRVPLPATLLAFLRACLIMTGDQATAGQCLRIWQMVQAIPA